MAVVSDTVFTLLLLATGVFGASTVGFAVAWMRARERAARAEERAMPVHVSGGADERFDRLEHVVESIAVEVERMAEGQRFVSKLLAERPVQDRVPQERGEAGAARVGRVVTPH